MRHVLQVGVETLVGIIGDKPEQIRLMEKT
jgi:hypothetical protein